MRVSTSLLLALPLLAAGAESPFEEYKAKFQNFLSSFGSAVAPGSSSSNEGSTTSQASPASSVAAATISPKTIQGLTLESWNETLYAPVQSGATAPEEWWVLVTGRNKTCFGHCLKVETAFNATALAFAALPKSPHLAYLNCEDQPVLCNAWGATTGSIWVLEMLPPPAPVDIYQKRLNLTSTTTQTLLDLHAAESKELAGFKLYEGFFHPYNGQLAQYGLSIPAGYFFWGFSLIPSWAMMIGVSFLSRTMMNRNINRRDGPQGAAGAAAGAPRGAPPGDGR